VRLSALTWDWNVIASHQNPMGTQAASLARVEFPLTPDPLRGCFMLLDQYLPVLFLGILALGLGVVLTLVSILLGPKKTSPIKKMPFESGMMTEGSQYRRYSVRFYMVALSFLIFDVEIVFFYPWAVKFREFGLYGLAVMSVFFVILLFGLAYDWKKGALEWE